MAYPEFYNQVPRILLRDPLAEFLGALEDGVVKFSYVEAVKVAGHSCPTVASAYLMTARALAHLYGAAPPERGRIGVEFKSVQEDGVNGVIASVAGMLTGAAGEGGFKGIAGRFDRRGLLRFGVAGLPGQARFRRRDTGAAVDAMVHLERVPADPGMGALLQKCCTGSASAEEVARFRALWQGRVKAILVDHWDDPALLTLASA
ncbi:MAG TPA: hypothetical protein VLC55_06275 [Burkholderiales bacterium]|nr:hypothetical protein [Burkholderiales bacterium]